MGYAEGVEEGDVRVCTRGRHGGEVEGDEPGEETGELLGGWEKEAGTGEGGAGEGLRGEWEWEGGVPGCCEGCVNGRGGGHGELGEFGLCKEGTKLSVVTAGDNPLSVVGPALFKVGAGENKGAVVGEHS